MTQTTPSHTQAVEAEPIAIVNKATCISVHRGNEVLANFAGPESHANAMLFAAALTSQQEVAAPAEFGPDEDGIVWPVPAMTTPSPNLAEYFSAPQVRAMIAASRVPVASLASREQGVEAVGAVPVTQPRLIGWRMADYTAETADRDLAENWSHNVDVLPIFEGDPNTKLCTAPSSSKTQDDLAGAGVESVLVQDDLMVMAVKAGATTAPEFWRGQVLGYRVEFPSLKALEDYTRAAIKDESTASQPKAPAPVPVVQGEAVPDLFTQGVNAAAAMLDKMADDFANEHSSQDPDTGVYEFGRGGKEDHYNTLRELADDIRSIVLDNPAPEQATTGSGQDSGSVHPGSGDRGEVQGPFRIAALADISAERTRQMRVKGWTPEHDSQHNNGELAEAASVYAMPNWKRRMSEGNPPTDQVWPIGWPWNLEDFKPKDDRRNLVKAGALILAEIERLDRAAILSTASPAGEVKK